MGETDGPRFGVVWRGYDRAQVDEAVRTAADPPAADRTADEATSATPVWEFDVVPRGYDRHEVERYFARFASLAAQRGMSMIDLFAAGEADEPSFGTALRGYSLTQVDKAVWTVANSTAEAAGAMRTRTFDVVLRGYDRHEVDQYFARLHK